MKSMHELTHSIDEKEVVVNSSNPSLSVLLKTIKGMSFAKRVELLHAVIKENSPYGGELASLIEKMSIAILPHGRIQSDEEIAQRARASKIVKNRTLFYKEIDELREGLENNRSIHSLVNMLQVYIRDTKKSATTHHEPMDFEKFALLHKEERILDFVYVSDQKNDVSTDISSLSTNIDHIISLLTSFDSTDKFYTQLSNILYVKDVFSRMGRNYADGLRIADMKLLGAKEALSDEQDSLWRLLRRGIYGHMIINDTPVFFAKDNRKKGNVENNGSHIIVYLTGDIMKDRNRIESSSLTKRSRNNALRRALEN